MKLNLKSFITGGVIMFVSILLINAPFALAANAGPNNAGAGTDVSGVGSSSWLNPTRVTANDNSYVTANGYSQTHYLEATNYGFVIPVGATVNGIQVSIGRFGTTGMGNDARDNTVKLIKEGNIVGNNKANTSSDWPSSETTANYGSSSDTWGSTWTYSDINASNFGVALSINPNNRTASVDYIQITVTYTPDTTAPSGGSISYADGTYTIVSVPLTYAIGTDSGAGLNLSSGKIQRASAVLTDGICGTFGSFADLVSETDGSYTDSSVSIGNCYKYQYVISDNVGNTATYTSANVAKIDVPSPVVTISSFPAVNIANETAVAISGTCSENDSIVSLDVNGITATPVCTANAWSATLDLSTLTDGMVTAGASQTNSNDKTGSDSKNSTKDTIAPTATVAYSATEPINTDVLATLNPSEAVTVTNNGGSVNYNFTDNGTFTFEFSDVNGNTGSAEATVANIDKIIPVVTIDSFPAVDNKNQSAVILSGTCSEEASIVSLDINGITAAPVCTANTWMATFDLGVLADGALSASASQTDAAGNTGSTTKDSTKVTISGLSVIVNVIGGTKTAADFAVTVAGADATPNSFIGSVSGTAVTITPDAEYNVSAGTITHYTAEYSADCSSTAGLTAGASATCTITETFVQPVATLNVVLNVINDNTGTNVPGDFTVHVNGANPNLENFPGGSDGTAVKINAEEDYSVSVATLSYTSSFSPDCVSSLMEGDNVTCTITMNDVAQLSDGQNAPNLIENPSLEISSAGLPSNWIKGGWGTNDRVLTYPVDGIGGGVAVKMTISSYTDGDAKWYFNEVPVIAGHSYTYRDDYISNASTMLTAEYFDAAHNHLSFGGWYSVTASAADWKDSQATFSVPDGAAYMTVFHSIQSAGFLTIDNASLTEVALPVPFSQGFVSLTFDDGFTSQYDNAREKLNTAGMKGTFYILTHLSSGFSIINPSLETANGTNPEGWNKSGSTAATYAYPVAGHNGDKAVEVSATQNGSNAAWYFTPVTVMPDYVYAFSEWYKSTANSELVALVTKADGTIAQVDATDAEGNTVDSSIKLASTGDVWDEVRTYFYIPSDAKTITVVNRLQGIGTLTVDDATMGIMDYMTADQVKDLQADGHEIGGHTQSHRDLTSLPIDEATTEISGGRQDLLDNGITTVKSFDYPYGAFNGNIQDAVMNSGYTSGRSVVPGFNGKRDNKFALFSESVNADTSLATIESWIDKAKADRTWLILAFHDITNNQDGLPYSTTPANLKTIINYIGAKSVPVKTVSEGIELMRTPTLNVITTVVNNFGGTAIPSDFNIGVTAKNPIPAANMGSEAGVIYNFDSGAYAAGILTALPDNYTASLSSGCSGSLAIGDAIAECTITISDKDITAPVISVHENIISEAVSPAGTAVEYTLPTATDDHDGAVTVNCSPVSGSIFAFGDTTVTCNAADASGNLAVATVFTVSVVDTTAPVITLNGNDTVTVELHGTYTEQGATVSDNNDANFSAFPSGMVDTETVGSYSIAYDATDSSGNVATQVIRTVNVVDTTAPAILIAGVAADGVDMSGDLSAGYILETNNVSDKEYLVQFKSGTVASESLSDEYFGLTLINSTVSADDLKAYYAARTGEPFLTYLNEAVDGINPFVYINGSTVKLVDGARHYFNAPDSDMAIPGNYPLGTYTVSGKIKDLTGNEATVTYILIVAGDRIAPVITLNGSTPDVERGTAYIELGATANDNTDGSFDATPSGVVDTSIVGVYTVIYTATDKAGNEAEPISRSVTVVDTLGPTATISFDQTAPTNGPVVATINPNEDVTVTNNDGLFSYTFDDNGSFTFEFIDVSGNSGSAVATVSNIDKIAPVATIGYNPTIMTNGSVIATLDPSESVIVTNNGGSFIYTFDDNGTFMFEFKDAAGNTGSVEATVNNIDKSLPGGIITYSTTAPTNGSVTATLDPSEDVIVTNNDGSFSYTFDTNGSFTFEFVDDAGNTGSAEAIVSNIDKVTPTAEIGYNPSAPTNGSVTATLNPSEDVIVTNNDGSLSYTFTDNGTFTFEFVDTAGNTGSAEAVVTNIDKTVPTATVSYDITVITNHNVIATLIPSKPVTITNNGGALEYVFTENGNFTFEFVDAAGNTGSTEATVNNIDKIYPVISLIGSSTVYVAVGATYTDLGATSSDNYDSDITSRLATSTNLDTSIAGTYQYNYDVSDAAGNEANQVSRTVIVSALGLSAEQNSSASTDSVTITWTTSHPASSRVLYDTVSHTTASSTEVGPANYGYSKSTVENANLVTNHSVTISGLTSNTTYFFRPVSHGSPETIGNEVTVTTAKVASSGGGGGGSSPRVVTKVATTTVATSTVATTTVPAVTAEPVKVLGVEYADYSGYSTLYGLTGELTNAISLSEAQIVFGQTAMTKMDASIEVIYNKVIKSYKGVLTDNQKYSLSFFIQTGTPTTKKLGAGERAGVVSSYLSAYGRLPEKLTDWQDTIKIGNGRWPAEKSATAEAAAMLKFKQVYKRDAVMANTNDNAAVSIIAYGLRSASRNMTNEAAAIKSFKAIFHQGPLSANDWDTVRAIAYSGAKR